MARRADLLTALVVENATTALGPGLHYDGGGLYLQVGEKGSRSWIYRYRAGKKLRDMGQGSADVVSLKGARKAAAKWRTLRTEGIDPIAKRAAEKVQEAAEGVTFKQAAVEYIAINSPTWRNKKHRDQWESTLKTYVYPIIGETGVGKVDTNAVLSILQPQWLTKAETMGRVRGRMEVILDFAKAKGWRQGENVARWAGHLKDLLPRRKSRKKRIQHHPSMPSAGAGIPEEAARAGRGRGAVSGVHYPERIQDCGGYRRQADGVRSRRQGLDRPSRPHQGRAGASRSAT